MLYNWLMRHWPKRFRGEIMERATTADNNLLIRYESGYCCFIDQFFKEYDLQEVIEFTPYRWTIIATINGMKSETAPMYKFQAIEWACKNMGSVIHVDDNIKTIFVRGTGDAMGLAK